MHSSDGLDHAMLLLTGFCVCRQQFGDLRCSAADGRYMLGDEILIEGREVVNNN